MIDKKEELERQAPITARVRELMKARKIRGVAIARALGYTGGWFSLVMSNKRGISIGELSKIAELLGVQLFELLPKPDEIREPKTIDEIVEARVLEILNRHKE